MLEVAELVVLHEHISALVRLVVEDGLHALVHGAAWRRCLGRETNRDVRDEGGDGDEASGVVGARDAGHCQPLAKRAEVNCLFVG